MTYTKPLGKYKHDRTKRCKKMLLAGYVAPEPDQAIPADGPCDGYTAIRMMHDWPLAERESVIETICERVAKWGGRT